MTAQRDGGAGPPAPAAGAPVAATPDAQPGAPAGDEGFLLHLPAFEGPLDLLLQLIEREELDITEVSLLHLTEQYMEQLRSRERIPLQALADFVVMGARLLLLKSRALLPRETLEDQGTEEEADPASLLAALEEYRRFKRAADHLHSLEAQQRTGYSRAAAPPDVPMPHGLDDLTLTSLADVFRDVLERLPEPDAPPVIERQHVRLRDRMTLLVERMDRSRRVPFRALIESAQTRLEVVVDFLAVLELIKARFLDARQAGSFGEIELIAIDGAAAPALIGLPGESVDPAGPVE